VAEIIKAGALPLEANRYKRLVFHSHWEHTVLQLLGLGGGNSSLLFNIVHCFGMHVKLTRRLLRLLTEMGRDGTIKSCNDEGWELSQ
jgi:hypothetical protein